MDEEFAYLRQAISGLFLDSEQQEIAIDLADRHHEVDEDPMLDATPKARPVPLPAESSPEPDNVPIDATESRGGFQIFDFLRMPEVSYLTVPEDWPGRKRTQVYKQISKELFAEELKRFGEPKDKVENWLEDQRTGRKSRRFGVGGYGAGYE